MAEIRCPKCGKSNPDLLDVCQYCQTPLKTDSVLRAGQSPTKKDTGELEAVLPQWLRDVRQQARDSAEEEAVQSAAQPKAEKDEAPDFLAGLASQTDNASDDDVPDWLRSINPSPGTKPSISSASEPEPESDFFAQFRQSEAKPSREPEQKQKDAPIPPAPAADQTSASEEDDLSKWFARAAEQPEEIVEIDAEPPRQDEGGWARNLEAPMQSPPPQEQAPTGPEDLSWLHNLEDASKQTGDLQAPQQDTDWLANLEAASTPAGPSGTQEDLSWLDNLGGVTEAPTPAAPTPASTQPFTTGEDLSWLNDLSAASQAQPFEAAPEKPVSAQPFASEEDLSWLNNLGGTPLPSQSVEAAPASSPQDDLSWLNDLGAGSGPQFAPPFLESDAGTQATPPSTPPFAEAQPDWLKSAAETPSASTPPAGDTSMDWFASLGQATEAQQAPAAQTPQPAGQASGKSDAFADLFSTPGEPAPLAGQDVDSLFSVEMPDWLSRSEPAAEEPAAPQAAELPPAGSEESLAPVDLPSWVQAMRPVEAVISETTPGTQEEQPEEKEGPLAGLRGVIPGSAVAFSKRPKPVALKLQATDEQQASAALLEKILGSETNPRALILSSFVASQRWLRVGLAVLFWLVLGAALVLRSTMMPIADELPNAARAAQAAVDAVPAGATNALVVIDYEPSLAGEMEATGGPLLDHLLVPRNNLRLSFVSTSPNGAALVERLLFNTQVDQLVGTKYDNLGFLPGGSAGVLGFMEKPGLALPAAKVKDFSEYALVILMTDHAESGRVWVEQLSAQKQNDPAIANQPLIVLASAQASPLLQPYVSSGQVTGMVSGLADAARYEKINLSRPGIARSYWDAFGIGLILSVGLIFIGSLWSLIAGIRARRAEAEQG